MLVFLGVGANLGEPIETIKKGWEELKCHPRIEDLKSSKIYRTDPVSDIPQPDYLNCVWSFETELAPNDLQALLQSIETKLGKRAVPGVKNAPRTIDFDILFLEGLSMDTDSLQVPHPRIFERAFVLVPLNDLTDHTPLPHNGEAKIQKLISMLPQESLHGVKQIFEWSLE